MEIGRKIYYNSTTGEILADTGERQGNVIETTLAQDLVNYPQLQGVTIDFIQLAYGERAEEFANMTSYSVNPTTKQLTINP